MYLRTYNIDFRVDTSEYDRISQQSFSCEKFFSDVVRPCPGESLAQATAKQQSQHVEGKLG